MVDSSSNNKRLVSLDILRGFDLFMLVFLQPVFGQLASLLNSDNIIRTFYESIFTHAEWEGFHAWDLVMPLFLFMTGASIPFAMSKFKKGEVSAKSLFPRIAKRIILLWIFGAIIQGNLLDINIDSLFIYSNTLQSIAAGYLLATLLYMYLPIRGVIAATIVLPIVYTIGMQMYGSYLPTDNLAEMIDRVVLGRFVEGASVNENGIVEFANWYNYAWVYPTINFTTTVLSGLLTGYFLRTKLDGKKKALYLLLAGVGCIALAFALSPVEPIIKKIWTSSMTLLSSGLSIALMAIFYYFTDVLQKGKWLNWLKFYGMNSILAYMLFNTLKINSLLQYWLHGLQQFVGDLYPSLITLAHVTIIFFILKYCYNKMIFLKV